MTAIRFEKHTGKKVETGGIFAVDVAKLAALGLFRGAKFLLRETYQFAKQQSHWLP